jgi:hypothetical protein
VSDQRITNLAERLLNDEHLRAALPDDAAAALQRWALNQLRVLAAANLSDTDLEARYAALRAALIHAAQSGLTTPPRLVQRARAALRAATRR